MTFATVSAFGAAIIFSILLHAKLEMNGLLITLLGFVGVYGSLIILQEILHSVLHRGSYEKSLPECKTKGCLKDYKRVKASEGKGRDFADGSVFECASCGTRYLLSKGHFSVIDEEIRIQPYMKMNEEKLEWERELEVG